MYIVGIKSFHKKSICFIFFQNCIVFKINIEFWHKNSRTISVITCSRNSDFRHRMLSFRERNPFKASYRNQFLRIIFFTVFNFCNFKAFCLSKNRFFWKLPVELNQLNCVLQVNCVRQFFTSFRGKQNFFRNIIIRVNCVTIVKFNYKTGRHICRIIFNNNFIKQNAAASAVNHYRKWWKLVSSLFIKRKP